MPRSEFGRQLQVAAPPDRCWAVLTDVPQLVEWVSIVEGATEIDPLARYRAVLADRLGPFKLRADIDITLHDVVAGRHVTVRAEGEDRHVGSRLAVDATLGLEPGDWGGTTVRVAGVYEVTGRVAAMGSGTINKKAERIVDEFFTRAAEELGRP
jgi:carbon monoxide dehydrogenase subunit G